MHSKNNKCLNLQISTFNGTNVNTEWCRGRQKCDVGANVSPASRYQNHGICNVTTVVPNQSFVAAMYIIIVKAIDIPRGRPGLDKHFIYFLCKVFIQSLDLGANQLPFFLKYFLKNFYMLLRYSGQNILNAYKSSSENISRKTQVTSWCLMGNQPLYHPSERCLMANNQYFCVILIRQLTICHLQPTRGI